MLSEKLPSSNHQGSQVPSSAKPLSPYEWLSQYELLIKHKDLLYDKEEITLTKVILVAKSSSSTSLAIWSTLLKPSSGLKENYKMTHFGETHEAENLFPNILA